MKTRAIVAGAFCVLAWVAPIVAANAPDRARMKKLLQALDTGDAKRQRSAIQELARRYGPKARPAVPSLIKLLQSPDRELGLRSAVALARIAPETPGLEPNSREALQGDNVQMRGGAAFGLACLGPREPLTVTPLIKTLGDENSDVALAAAAALARMGKPAVTPLLAALDSANKNVRQLAAQALGRIGVPATGRSRSWPNSWRTRKAESKPLRPKR